MPNPITSGRSYSIPTLNRHHPQWISFNYYLISLTQSPPIFFVSHEKCWWYCLRDFIHPLSQYFNSYIFASVSFFSSPFYMPALTKKSMALLSSASPWEVPLPQSVGNSGRGCFIFFIFIIHFPSLFYSQKYKEVAVALNSHLLLTVNFLLISLDGCGQVWL